LKNAEGITALLNTVTPSTIMNKNFSELIKYSKAAAQTVTAASGEVLLVAAQTADATLDIREKILGIQNSTDETVCEVGNISKVILEMNEIVTSIAAAIEEQFTAAAEVAENV
jgi:methyl-accepting chemotaxis protein